MCLWCWVPVALALDDLAEEAQCLWCWVPVALALDDLAEAAACATLLPNCLISHGGRPPAGRLRLRLPPLRLRLLRLRIARLRLRRLPPLWRRLRLQPLQMLRLRLLRLRPLRPLQVLRLRLLRLRPLQVLRLRLLRLRLRLRLRPRLRLAQPWGRTRSGTNQDSSLERPRPFGPLPEFANMENLPGLRVWATQPQDSILCTRGNGKRAPRAAATPWSAANAL